MDDKDPSKEEEKEEEKEEQKNAGQSIEGQKEDEQSEDEISDAGTVYDYGSALGPNDYQKGKEHERASKASWARVLAGAPLLPPKWTERDHLDAVSRAQNKEGKPRVPSFEAQQAARAGGKKNHAPKRG